MSSTHRQRRLKTSCRAHLEPKTPRCRTIPHTPIVTHAQLFCVHAHKYTYTGVAGTCVWCMRAGDRGATALHLQLACQHSGCWLRSAGSGQKAPSMRAALLLQTHTAAYCTYIMYSIVWLCVQAKGTGSSTGSRAGSKGGVISDGEIARRTNGSNRSR